MGDYLSVAILGTLDDGSVAPEGLARREGRERERDGYWGRDRDWDWEKDRDRGPRRERDRRAGLGSEFPEGEWQRGQRVPERRGRGRDRRY